MTRSAQVQSVPRTELPSDSILPVELNTVLSPLRMKLSIAPLLLLISLTPAWAAPSQLNCDFKIQAGVPFCDVEVDLTPAGTPGAYATVTEWGKSHRETVTLVSPAAGEQLHLVLSKESPDNSVELIVSSQAADSEGDTQLKSELVNPHVPEGYRIVNGTCQLK